MSTEPFGDAAEPTVLAAELGSERSLPTRSATQDGGSSVTIYPDGPLVLRGDFVLRHADGQTVPTGRVIALCRCGKSAVKPFCDNSHQFGVRRADES